MGGCCKFLALFGVVPLSVLVAVLFETPDVLELSPDQLAGLEEASASDGAAETAEPSAPSQPEFGTATSDGMGSGSMFDRIAFAYDKTNKFLSIGLDQRWRNALINDCMRLQKGDHVLDLATGTADVSILAGESLRALGDAASQAQAASVMGLDPSSEMLRRGVAKVEGQGLKGMVRLVKGDAQDLSTVRDIDAQGTLAEPSSGVASDSVDKISMSFGIRNVPDRSLALQEMRRVLRKRGESKVCILELSLPSGEKFLSKVARTFITKVVPLIGRVATMNSGGEEYQYLERSILKFPKPTHFAAEMARAGLSVRSITSFAYGAVNLYAASPSLPASA